MILISFRFQIFSRITSLKSILNLKSAFLIICLTVYYCENYWLTTIRRGRALTFDFELKSRESIQASVSMVTKKVGPGVVSGHTGNEYCEFSRHLVISKSEAFMLLVVRCEYCLLQTCGGLVSSADVLQLVLVLGFVPKTDGH